MMKPTGIRLIVNPKSNPEYKRGFTHRLVTSSGGFLFVHKSRVVIERKKLQRIAKQA